jgi:hypothetical protein
MGLSLSCHLTNAGIAAYEWNDFPPTAFNVLSEIEWRKQSEFKQRGKGNDRCLILLYWPD